METKVQGTEDALPSRFLGWDRSCSCGRTHRVPTRVFRLEPGLLARLPDHLVALGHERHVHVVTHQKLWNRLSRALAQALSREGFLVTSTVFPEDDLVPDETAARRLDRECPPETDLALAVGSGVVHDLTRHLAFERGFDFDSVPTAPSMDGYASGVSPLLRQGFKETVPGKPPRAIWADLDVLAAAPAAMIAAGVGDLAGKALCLRDWELGALLTGEYHCRFVSDLMDEAWSRVKSRLKAIRLRRPEAIRVLMESLVLSGMGMVMVGNSRPASGAEHHLSHFWEMRAHAQGRPPQLHGLKVAIASLQVAQEVRRLRSLLGPPWKAPAPASEGLRKELRRVYGPLAATVERESLSGEPLAVAPAVLDQALPTIRGILERIPSPREVRGWLKEADIPAHPGSLGVSQQDVSDALRYSPYLRSRYTVLRLRDQVAQPLGWLAPLAVALVAANVVLAAFLVSAGVVASVAWRGDADGLRQLESRWVMDPRTAAWEVESRGGAIVWRTAWDGSRWIMSGVSETPQASGRRSP